MEPQEHAHLKSEAISNDRRSEEDIDNNDQIFSIKRVTEDFLCRLCNVLPNAPSAVVRVSALLSGTRAGVVRCFHQVRRDFVPDGAVRPFLVVDPPEAVERPLLEIVMRETRGNISRAAQILGIERSTLDRKLKRYNVSRPTA